MQVGIDLRVLHPIAHGQTWYARWGYGFGRGTLNIPQAKWEAAVSKLHRARLDAVWPACTSASAAARLPLAAVLARYTGAWHKVGLTVARCI